MIICEVAFSGKETKFDVIAFPVNVHGFTWKARKGVPMLEQHEIPFEEPILRCYRTKRRYALPCIIEGLVNVEHMTKCLDGINLTTSKDVHVWRPWDSGEPKAIAILTACQLSIIPVVVHRDKPPSKRRDHFDRTANLL